jgi:starch synthase (maltosyl-transferring)
MPPLQMQPRPGCRLVRHVGDRLFIDLHGVPEGWMARVRTNVGRAEKRREELISAHFALHPIANASWRDIPMQPRGAGVWRLEIPTTEVGFFKAKPFALDPEGFQHWPDGPDIGISVHPSWSRTSHPIYCAFPRMFGPKKGRRSTHDPAFEARLKELDALGYAVIPPSGTLRDVQRELPHIVHRLGCRLLHLLPVSPTPTTFARFGRFGSPYALQDLTAIDPALVEFDQRTTGIQQFCELAFAVHDLGARLMLDLVINHTGWGSTLWEQHPEWFVRRPDGRFESPGAWDVVWEDLVELDQRHAPLWEHLAEAFVTWCRRGVDAFRCDAGYKIPTHVWEHITARVQQEFPETLFLLEGLGGPWDATDALLGEGGMQWAYSELFQNFSPEAVTGYLDHTLRFGQSTGILVHYSETHDNSRLAAHSQQMASNAPGISGHSSQEISEVKSPNLAWSLYRNRLSALTSVQGAFGFTNGVEWAATEQINVHSARGLAWGCTPNLVDELAKLNQLLRYHPCFFDGAALTRISRDHSPVYALKRVSAEGLDTVVVLINLDPEREQHLILDDAGLSGMERLHYDLLTGMPIPEAGDGRSTLGIPSSLFSGAVLCLSATPEPRGLSGDAYRQARARADWALTCWWAVRSERPKNDVFSLPTEDWPSLGRLVDQDAEGFLNRCLGHGGSYSLVCTWTPEDVFRIFQMPPHHWLLIRNPARFRACLETNHDQPAIHVESIPTASGWIAAIPPTQLGQPGRRTLKLERFQASPIGQQGLIQILGAHPVQAPPELGTLGSSLVLLTNGRGGMSRVPVHLGHIFSKYDCLLGANLNPTIPVDRHIFIKRVRAWVDADGFISQLDAATLIGFEPGPPPQWRFVAPSGDGRFVAIRLKMDLVDQSNTVILSFSRDSIPEAESGDTRPLPPGCRVALTVRFDIEDRSFHSETKRNAGSEAHFALNCHPIPGKPPGDPGWSCGFRFVPSPDRRCTVVAQGGEFHAEPEWSVNIPHPREAERGQESCGDAYSPGWFELPLPETGSVTLVASAEEQLPGPESIDGSFANRVHLRHYGLDRAGLPMDDVFGRSLVEAAHAFLVRRDETRSVIAGYPWFLDWGRDSLIAARGMLAAGLHHEVRELLLTFARFEQNGTLPNSIHGDDASNRDTSDAPLWFGIVCEEVAAGLTPGDAEAFYSTVVDASGRTLAAVLRSIACGYLAGTVNGIRVDAPSGLVWSPSHFTWMDTNYPAGTPREGYPIEIQALWVRLLRQLATLPSEPWEGRGERWGDLARRAEKSIHSYFWMEDLGWYGDVLLAGPGVNARMGAPSDALRSNCLFLVSLGIDQHPDFKRRAQRMVAGTTRHLLIPGALRSLAPLAVNPPLPIRGPGGGLLNDPQRPYWPRYVGDEDTRRKPAYHNGTGWLWTFPTFIEALVKAHPDDPSAKAAARSYLAHLSEQLQRECLGQLPEVCDGDAPHASRGCDAQAWSVTEVLRVWRWLGQEHD